MPSLNLGAVALVCVIALGGAFGGSRGQQAAIAPQAASAPPEFGSISLHSDAPNGTAFCRGLMIGTNAMTARHCVRHALDILVRQQRPVFLRHGDRVTTVDRAKLEAMASASFAAQAASFNSDFNVFSWPGLGPPVPSAALPNAVGRPKRDETVLLDGGAGATASCTVTAICGSTFLYSCKPAPISSWSGSPIWSTDSPRRLLGVHLGEARMAAFKGVSSLTILGRSSGLFGNANAFSDLIARSSGFAHRWDAICASRVPAVASGSPLQVSQLPVLDGVARGLAANAQGRLLTATTQMRWRVCLLKGDAAPTWACGHNGAPTRDRINAIEWLGSARFAFAEAKLEPYQIIPSTPLDLRTGGISVVTLDEAAGKPAPVYGTRVSSTVGGIYVLKQVGTDLFAGGDDGLCVIAEGSGQCERICYRPGCSGEDWRVNGIAQLGPDLVIAAGRDMRDGQIIPAFNLYRRSPAGWKMRLGALDASLTAAASRLADRRTGLQLKAPIRLPDGTVLLFGSDGGAWRVSGERIAGRVPIIETWDVDGVDASREVLEDAVRDALVLPNGMIAVAASDGCVRLLRPQMRDGQLVLVGAQRLTVFDRGIWVTELELVGTTLFARAQDGNITKIDLKTLLAAK